MIHGWMENNNNKKVKLTSYMTYAYACGAGAANTWMEPEPPPLPPPPQTRMRPRERGERAEDGPLRDLRGAEGTLTLTLTLTQNPNQEPRIRTCLLRSTNLLRSPVLLYCKLQLPHQPHQQPHQHQEIRVTHMSTHW